MTIDKEFPTGSIVINKKSKKRYKIVNRIDVLHVPFHYFELTYAEKITGMVFQRDYFTLKEKFMLEESEQVSKTHEARLYDYCHNRRTDCFCHRDNTRTIVIDRETLSELEAKAEKWDMIQWAVKNEIKFIFDGYAGEFIMNLSEMELEKLEQLYKGRDEKC